MHMEHWCKRNVWLSTPLVLDFGFKFDSDRAYIPFSVLG
jgi:hypothetical protein